MASVNIRELEIAKEAVSEATKLCRSVQSTIEGDVIGKADRSPVTVADFGSQALICRKLAHAFPDDPVVAEEDTALLRASEHADILGRVVRHVAQFQRDADENTVCQWIEHGGAHEYSDRFWTLDPIDGTKGFLRREQYAIALALIENGKIQVAVLACPNLWPFPGPEGATGAMFSAVRGQGTSVLSAAGEPAARRIRVSCRKEVAQARVCESVESAHSSHGDAQRMMLELGIAAGSLRLDSQAKYAVVARGEADIYMRLPTSAEYRENIWDHAAGVLVVSEEGGVVADLAGRPLDFTHGPKLRANRGVVASNGILHEDVLASF